MQTQPYAILWDMDGTLVDTIDMHWRAYRAVLEDLKVTPSYDIFLEAVRKSTVSMLLGENSPRESYLALTSGHVEQFSAIVQAEAVQLQPGVAHWLDRFAQLGFLQGLVTNSARDITEMVIGSAGLTGRFQVLVTGDEIERRKPDPSSYLLAAERLGIDPRRCLVIEDSPAGITAGRDAGMRTIAVRSTLFDLAGDLIIDKLEELNEAKLQLFLESLP